MHDPKMQRRFRIFLHLLRRMEVLDSSSRRRTNGLPSIVQPKSLEGGDWLAYETLLYEEAAVTVLEIEHHLDALGGMPSHGAWAQLATPPDPENRPEHRLQALQVALVAAFAQSEALDTPEEAS